MPKYKTNKLENWKRKRRKRNNREKHARARRFHDLTSEIDKRSDPRRSIWDGASRKGDLSDGLISTSARRSRGRTARHVYHGRTWNVRMCTMRRV